MSGRKWSLQTASPEETRAVGECLGTLMPPSAALLLIGDLGAGKTCLVQGLARGLDIPSSDPVTSPSYTLLNVHEGGRLPLYHFDLYRLSHADDLLDLGFDEYLYGNGVTVIEWADRIPDQNWSGLRVHLVSAGAERRHLEFVALEEPYLNLVAVLEKRWRERGKSS